jgi:glycogen(starch) synthase
MKVLSLAWKYHPKITSGVGVACEGLNNALSKLTELTVIYPTVTSTKVEEEVVLSVDALEEHQIQALTEVYDSIKSHHRLELPIRLDPYFVSTTEDISLATTKTSKKTSGIGTQSAKITKEVEVKTTRTVEKLQYDEVDVFGERVRDKISLFNHLVDSLANNIDFDVIHAHDWMTFLAGIQLKDKFQKPLCLHVHSLEYDRVGHKDVGWVYDIERFAMSRADAVITVSEYSKGVIQSNYGLSGSNIHVVYNAITPCKATPLKDKTLKDGFKVLFAGRIDDSKGIEYFMQIARAVQRRTSDINFVVVGRGNERQNQEQIHEFDKYDGQLQYLGFVDRESLFGLYQQCDVFCMPSMSEPFGLAAIEAASSGIPVILSTKTGATEVLKDTLTADFWDIDKFASYIVALKTDNRLRTRVVNSNRRAVETLSWESSAEKIKGIFEQLY